MNYGKLIKITLIYMMCGSVLAYSVDEHAVGWLNIEHETYGNYDIKCCKVGGGLQGVDVVCLYEEGASESGKKPIAKIKYDLHWPFTMDRKSAMHVDYLFVEKAYRGEGIGSALLTYALRDGALNNRVHAMLCADPQDVKNDPHNTLKKLVKFYSKFGFEVYKSGMGGMQAHMVFKELPKYKTVDLDAVFAGDFTSVQDITKN